MKIIEKDAIEGWRGESTDGYSSVGSVGTIWVGIGAIVARHFLGKKEQLNNWERERERGRNSEFSQTCIDVYSVHALNRFVALLVSCINIELKNLVRYLSLILYMFRPKVSVWGDLNCHTS